MASELFIDAKEIIDRCLFPVWEKIAVNEPQPIGGVWEQVAAFDDRSPAFYYAVRFSVIVVEGFACPEEVKIHISELRDFLGEGPFPAQFTGTTKIVDFTNLRWAGPPSISDDQQKYELFTIEFQTEDTPISSDVPPPP